MKFHFSDLSQHTDRVRDKVLQLEKETMNILPGELGPAALNPFPTLSLTPIERDLVIQTISHMVLWIL
jgi:hypothetical protein